MSIEDRSLGCSTVMTSTSLRCGERGLFCKRCVLRAVKDLEIINRNPFEEVERLEARVEQLENLAIMIWEDYLEHDEQCCPELRLPLVDEIYEKRKI